MLTDSRSNDPVQKAGLWDQCKRTLLIKKGQKSCLFSEKEMGLHTYLPLVEKKIVSSILLIKSVTMVFCKYIWCAGQSIIAVSESMHA